MAKAKKLPSGNWRTQVYLGRDAAGKPIVESFTASTARESERLAAVAAADRKRKKKQTLTLGQAMDEFIDTCRVQGYSPSTLRGYVTIRKNSFPSLVNAKLDQITPRDVQKALDDRAREHTPKTVRNDYFFLKTILEKNVPDLQLNGIVLAKLKRKKKQLFSEKWAGDVLRYVAERWETDFYLYCCFIVSAGLRPSEAYALTWGDLSASPIDALDSSGRTYKIGTINIDKAIVRGEKGFQPKGTKSDAGERVLRVDWSFFENLYDAKPRGKDNEQVFQMKPSRVIYRWDITRKDLGLPETMRFYDLRHFFATSVAYSGASEEELARVMGHSTSAFSHQVYVELFRERQDEINAKMAAGTAALYGSVSAKK